MMFVLWGLDKLKSYLTELWESTQMSDEGKNIREKGKAYLSWASTNIFM